MHVRRSAFVARVGTTALAHGIIWLWGRGIVGMEWGSTKPGELFTGSKRWQAEVKGDRLSLWVDSQPKVAAHLIQLRSIQVSTGMMWATCHFDFQKGEDKFRSTLTASPTSRPTRCSGPWPTRLRRYWLPS